MSFIKNSIFGTFRDPCPACCPSRGISAAQQPQHQLRGGLIAFVTNILKYICFCLPINFLEFHFSCQQSSFFKILAALPYDWQMLRQKNILRRATALGAPRVHGGLFRCIDLWRPLHVFFAPNSAPLPSHLQFYHCWLSHYLISWWGESFVHNISKGHGCHKDHIMALWYFLTKTAAGRIRYCKRLPSPTGQEQACTRITRLFVRHHAKNGPIHRKMVVDFPLVITSKVKPFSRPY